MLSLQAGYQAGMMHAQDRHKTDRCINFVRLNLGYIAAGQLDPCEERGAQFASVRSPIKATPSDALCIHLGRPVRTEIDESDGQTESRSRNISRFANCFPVFFELN